MSALRAAGEDTRLRVLALLGAGELSVKDITAILGQSQPRVSRHLKLLADAGLVERHAEGAWAYYRLADRPPGSDLVGWLLGALDPDDAANAADRERLAAIRAAQHAQATAFFAKVAGSWDQLRALHVPEAAVEAATLEILAGRQIDTLLDLGTGTGRMLELLAPLYRQGVGIDSSREMIAVARAKLAAAGIANAQVRLGDILDLEPGTRAADVVVLHQVLHYFDDPGRMLAAARNGLAAGGSVVVVDFAPHAHEFLRTEQAHRRLGLSESQMQGWASAARLSVAEIRHFPNPADPAGLTVSLWHLVDQKRSAS
ncbi:ArsR/SmtB family transcription factor [Devosia enhydra]|uniref:ArsR/SmtB family transcription factor n=1 Tax=Devosia enhydra TaxID=665118 RepID=UPI001FCE1627|nr:metalloregulator ArsR/SmtB family transcription factor [Devosia enhydra]